MSTKLEQEQSDLDRRHFMLGSIPREFIPEFLSGRYRVTNLPEDTAVSAGSFDFQFDSILLRLEHPSFALVAEGAEIPVMRLEFECCPARAAAPDLLEACHAAEEALRLCYDISEYPASDDSVQQVALSAVRAAIAKAEGAR